MTLDRNTEVLLAAVLSVSGPIIGRISNQAPSGNELARYTPSGGVELAGR